MALRPADGPSGTLARRVGEAGADIGDVSTKFQGKILNNFMEEWFKGQE